MNREHLTHFEESFERCKKDTDFIRRFYDFFIEGNPAVKDKFAGVNMKNQIDMLLISLSYMMMAYKQPNMLQKTAVKHDRSHFNIEPYLYDLWMDCMIQAVGVSDAQFDHEVELAWREVLRPGIEYMKSQY